MKTEILTVTQLNDFVKMTLDNSPFLRSVGVSGEISNFKYHYASGHIYFTLKDSTSQLKCVMFRSDAVNLKFSPGDGMKVVCTGSVRVYTAGGTYQLYVNDILPDGVGSLYLAYEQLKAKLESEGLFDKSVKKPIPKYPEKIGVITSQTGAAVRDIINIAGRRYPLCEITVYPAIVQGENAEKTLISGLSYFNEKEKADLIIIGRGGGSLEDLYAFNSEALARAIRKSDVPVISAVGHETDFTICDFASDLRAPTPSAAAELAVPDSIALKGELASDYGLMKRALGGKIEKEKKMLGDLSRSGSMKSLYSFIADKRLCLDGLGDKMRSEIRLITLKKRSAFE
ncbi:MAG: exodeoxyribonuclease VII large subunit, partial [Clostridia bacterium]|nr:exodeoxyribonuclease VII large subunit [Clostridia bacterium]